MLQLYLPVLRKSFRAILILVVLVGLIMLFQYKQGNSHNNIEEPTPAKSLRKVIDLYRKLEYLQYQLTTVLKKDAFLDLIDDQVGPVEDLIVKESNEMQMYLREFSPGDLLILQDFEETIELVKRKIDTIPDHINLVMKQKSQKKSELTKIKLNIDKEFEAYEEEIINLETVGIQLNIRDSEGKVTSGGGSPANVNSTDIYEILHKLVRYFETLEKLEEQATIIGRHTSYIDPEESGAYVQGAQLATIIAEKDRTMEKLSQTVFKNRSVLRQVHPNCVLMMDQINDYLHVLEHRESFCEKEWIKKQSDLKIQYNMLKTLLGELRRMYGPSTNANKEL